MPDDPHLHAVNSGGQDSRGGGQDLARQQPGEHEPARQGGLPPVSPHLLTWWFGLMAIGGVTLGIGADEHPFGRGVLAHPLAVFAACVLAGLLTLRFLHARPVMQLISARSLVAGTVIGVGCFFLGQWFGASLMHMP